MSKKRFNQRENPAQSDETDLQAVDFQENSTSNEKEPDTQESPSINEEPFVENTEEQPIATDEVQSKPKAEKKLTGTPIAILALLVALGIGGAGYFLGSEKLTNVEAQISSLKMATTQQSQQTSVEIPNFDAEKAQLAKLTADYQDAQNKISLLEKQQSSYTQQITELQLQLQKMGSVSSADNSAWLLSDANFLLNNALRKMVLDNDIDTTKSLLTEADGVLAKVSNPQIMAVREAIGTDLKNLGNVNNVDQNALMQRLTALANHLDDLAVIENNQTDDQASTTGEVSDSINDWQQNIEKSANSFLDHFIRVSDRNKPEEKAFVAPNQEIYLRENIRLRLQIAILAIPRQQNELYKQSLETVATWIRSYFDTSNENVKSFLKELDNLADQSIYIDAPEHLQSLDLLNKVLNKAPQQVDKIEIKEEKALEQPTQTSDEQTKPSAQ